MRATDKVTTLLSDYLRRVHPRQARRIVQAFNYYAGLIEAHKKRPNPEEAGSIAWGLLDAMDREIAERLPKDAHAHRIACKPGCAACCRIEVRVTEGEAALMAYGALQLNAPPVAARLAAQAEQPNWDDIPPEFRACAFLGADNQCTVYAYRPGACRKYFTLDNPELCDTEKKNGAQVINLIVPEAEVIASAMISRQGSGRMANMVIAAMRD